MIIVPNDIVFSFAKQHQLELFKDFLQKKKKGSGVSVGLQILERSFLTLTDPHVWDEKTIQIFQSF